MPGRRPSPVPGAEFTEEEKAAERRRKKKEKDREREMLRKQEREVR